MSATADSNGHAFPGERILTLDRFNPRDLDFTRQVFGFQAEARGWFRERNRFYYFPDKVAEDRLPELVARPAPPPILDPPPPPLPEGPLSRLLFTMDDGTSVTWIRHPDALPAECRSHWRGHTHLFVVQGRNPEYTAYTSIFNYAALDGADGRFRLIGPGGIRWIDYPNREAALNDALDMSLAVAMKIQVVATPSAGNKIAVYGDYANVGPALASIFAAYERLGLIVTSADLGLSIAQLEEHALPKAPTSLVPLGVYRHGLPSALITADAAFACLGAMAEHMGAPAGLDGVVVSIQGLGEVGFRMAGYLVEAGARLIITEADASTRARFEADQAAALASRQVEFLDDLEAIYDAPADIFVPCALRDILTTANLARLKTAGVRMVGGPANNLFPDQVTGPWDYHRAGLPVVPYEGIGAGGVTGVAYSVMTGILGQCPFTPEEKVVMIRDYVARVLEWSREYDLPPQVVSDRVLYRRAMRRRMIGQARSDEILERMGRAFDLGDAELERAVVQDCTKRGFFQGPGRFTQGGGDWLDR